MNYTDAKIALDNGETLTRAVWVISERTIKLNKDTGLIEVGYIGKKETIHKPQVPHNDKSTLPYESIEAWDDDLDDWFIVC